MHFYFFFYLFTPDLVRFRGFFSVFRVVCRLSLSPIQELGPGATPYRGGRCAAAILADRSNRKTKYFIDYDYKLPPVESNHRKGHAGHEMDGLLIHLDELYRLAVDITVTGLA